MSGARSQARRAAVQAIYQWQITAQTPADIAAQFRADRGKGRFDAAYFSRIVNEVPERVAELDAYLTPLLGRTITEVDPVERSILRIGAYELIACPEVPWRTVIDEAVTWARTFGAEQGHRYVNGVLDALARRVRPEAVGSARPKRGKPLR